MDSVQAGIVHVLVSICVLPYAGYFARCCDQISDESNLMGERIDLLRGLRERMVVGA